MKMIWGEKNHKCIELLSSDSVPFQDMSAIKNQKNPWKNLERKLSLTSKPRVFFKYLQFFDTCVFNCHSWSGNDSSDIISMVSE